jgi:hypothetical protein
MNLNQLFENTNSGGNYAEDLAKQVFDANPNIRDENQILDAAWPLAVTTLGNKRAMSVFNYDKDFLSDLVSVYGWLQKDQQGMAEDTPRFDPLVAKIAAKMKGPTWNDAEAALVTVLGTSAYNERKHFYKLWIDQAIDKYSKEGITEGMDDSPVAGAITRRIMLQRVDLLSKYGPEKVLNAIDEVADFVGDTEEIGSSDVSGWVRQVEQTLGQMEQGLGEAGRNYHANTTGFARGARDDERHDLDRDSQTWYIRLNGKLIRDKQGMPYSFRGKAAANKAAVTMQAKLFNQGKEFVLTTNPNDPQQGVAERVEEAANAKQQAAIAIAKKKELAEFAPPSGNNGDSGRWYTDDELADIIGDDWFEDFDVSNDGFNIDAYGEKAKQNLVGYANSWFDDKDYNVNVLGVEHNDVDHDLKWYIVGSFHNPRFAEQGVAEGSEQQYAVTIDAIDHGVLAPVTVVASSEEEAKQKAIAGVKASMIKRGYELMVRRVSAKPEQGVAESKSKPSNLLLWEQAQSVASSKFDSRLTEAADQWAKIWYKNKGGVWQ